MLVDLARTLGLSPGPLGLALMSGGVASIPVMFVGGRLVDRGGARRVIAAGALLLTLSFGGHVLATGFWGLVAGLLLYGCGGGLYDVGINAAAARHEAATRRRAMAWLHAGFSGGAVAGALGAGAVLAAGLPFRGVYGAVCGAMALLALAAWGTHARAARGAAGRAGKPGVLAGAGEGAGGGAAGCPADAADAGHAVGAVDAVGAGHAVDVGHAVDAGDAGHALGAVDAGHAANAVDAVNAGHAVGAVDATGAAVARAGAAPGGGPAEASLAPFGAPARSLYRPGPVLGLAVMTLAGYYGESAMEAWSAIYLRDDLGVAALVGASGVAVFHAAMTAGRLGAGVALRHVGRRTWLGTAGLLAALGTAIAVAVPAPGVAIAGLLLVGFGLSGVAPLAFSLAGEVAPRRVGEATAVITTVGYAGGLLAPGVIGAIAEHAGLRLALATVALGGLGITALALRMRAEGH